MSESAPFILGDIASRPRHVRFSFKANSKKANSYCDLAPRAYRSSAKKT